ncbi:MAG: hypothetical protein QOK20_2453, partial [Acidimicrobiaceae bacterium]|nr:hypothetical protein [Acidimicrobiaceae bacterium]
VIAAPMPGRGGPHLAKYEGLAYASDLTTLDVRGRGPFPYQLDGDYLGEVEQLELRYQPDLLSLVVPVPSRTAGGVMRRVPPERRRARW